MVALASAARNASAPHGGLRAFRPKSTRLHAINFRVVCGADLVTLPSKFGAAMQVVALASAARNARALANTEEKHMAT